MSKSALYWKHTNCHFSPKSVNVCTHAFYHTTKDIQTFKEDRDNIEKNKHHINKQVWVLLHNCMALPRGPGFSDDWMLGVRFSCCWLEVCSCWGRQSKDGSWPAERRCAWEGHRSAFSAKQKHVHQKWKHCLKYTLIWSDSTCSPVWHYTLSSGCE